MTMIRVPREVHDHLAEPAAERGVSIGRLLESLVADQPTATQRAGRLAADREVVRRVIGVGISDEEFDRAPHVHGNIYKIVAEKVRASKSSAA